MASRDDGNDATSIEIELVQTAGTGTGGSVEASTRPPGSTPASTSTMGGGFWLLMWKNMLLQRRRMVALVIQLGLPVMFFLIMVFVRDLTQDSVESICMRYTPAPPHPCTPLHGGGCARVVHICAGSTCSGPHVDCAERYIWPILSMWLIKPNHHR